MSKRRPKSNATENRAVRALDDLAAFERFQDELLPTLRKATEENWSAEKIWSHPRTQALLAARAVTIAATDPDAGKALAAIKDVMDRAHGRATEKKEIKHQLEKLPDEQLDALLETTMAEMGIDEDDLLQ